jgi:2',3'-cyclic-nucleotide 2'-phosphodiesterase/3'-nucleotidase
MCPRDAQQGRRPGGGHSHGGLDNSAYDPAMENGNWHLSKVPGIDAMLIGHSHQIFPNAAARSASSTCPGRQGQGHGQRRAHRDGQLLGQAPGRDQAAAGAQRHQGTVDSSATTVEARSTQNADKSYVAADPAVASTVASEHAATIQYVKTPIGSTTST